MKGKIERNTRKKPNNGKLRECEKQLINII